MNENESENSERMDIARGPEVDEINETPSDVDEINSDEKENTEKSPEDLFRSSMYVGQRIDVLDTVDMWSEAEICAIDRTQERILVHYVYWSAKYDEWIDMTSARLARAATKTYFEGGVLKVHHRILVQDTVKKWLEAYVIDESVDKVLVHYKGWGSKFDEWISRTSERILPYRGKENGRAVRSKSRRVLSARDVLDRGAQEEVVTTRDRFEVYHESLSIQDLYLVDIRGDGNCLFRAISHQIYGSQRFHRLVREKCMSYMESERAFFSQFVEGNMNDFMRYIDIKRQNGIWGDDPEIQAMSEIYDRPVEIWAYDQQSGAQKLTTFHESIDVLKEPVRLSYYGGGHYDSLVREHHRGYVHDRRPGELEDHQIELSHQRNYGLSEDELRRTSNNHRNNNLENQTLVRAIEASRRAFDDMDLDLEEALKRSCEDQIDMLTRNETDIEYTQRRILESVRKESEEETLRKAIEASKNDDLNEALLESLKDAYGLNNINGDEINDVLNVSKYYDSNIDINGTTSNSEDDEMQLAIQRSLLNEQDSTDNNNNITSAPAPILNSDSNPLYNNMILDEDEQLQIAIALSQGLGNHNNQSG